MDDSGANQDHSTLNGSENVPRLRDELDELFNYVPPPEQATGAAHSSSNSMLNRTVNDNNGPTREDLGIDEEIKVRKARAPVAKLDEERLLSANGIPKLRRISKKRLRFRGKGHEFSDVARLLNTYQLWLDDLFPKAKFADGLQLIEKLGHKKRIQIMRKAWIDEGRYNAAEDESLDPEASEGGKRFTQQHGYSDEAVVEPEKEALQIEKSQSQTRDLYSASPMPMTQVQNLEMNVRRLTEGSEPDEDELDALLAERLDEDPQAKHNISEVHSFTRPVESPRADIFADDEDAMAEMYANS